MSPSYVTRTNGNEVMREPGNELLMALDLHVREIRIRHGEVSLYDEEGRESLLITRGTHPGAGMTVDFADHVPTQETIGSTPEPLDQFEGWGPVA